MEDIYLSLYNPIVIDLYDLCKIMSLFRLEISKRLKKLHRKTGGGINQEMETYKYLLHVVLNE